MLCLLIEFCAVAGGGIIGTFCGRNLPEHITTGLTRTFGVCAIGMGVYSILQMENMPAVVLSIVIGTFVGLTLHFESIIQKGARGIHHMLSRMIARETALDESLFITAVVLFCAGASGICGALELGMAGNPSLMLTKSIMDFFTAIIFSCTLGLATSTIAIPQFCILFSLYKAADILMPMTTVSMIGDLRACGGFLLLATGFRIFKLIEFPVIEMTLGLVFVMPLSHFWSSYVIGIY